VLNVKRTSLWAGLTAGVLSVGLVGYYAFGQGVAPVRAPARPAGAPSIALLDVSYIFEKHPRFRQMMEQMKTDVERAEVAVKAERQAIQKLIDGLDQYKGSARYKQMEEEVTTRQGNLAVQIQLQKKEFLQREAKIYHNVYKEIQDEVDHYCAANGIDMVLRFNGDPVDADTPQSVLAYINRPVVWYNNNRDITPVILDILKKRVGTRTGPDTLPLR
jgi:Skp family chaperone for outer membrane proteins